MLNYIMNLNTSKLIRFRFSNFYSIEYTYRKSYIIEYISKYYRVYKLRYKVIKALGGCEIKRTSLY